MVVYVASIPLNDDQKPSKDGLLSIDSDKTDDHNVNKRNSLTGAGKAFAEKEQADKEQVEKELNEKQNNDQQIKRPKRDTKHTSDGKNDGKTDQKTLDVPKEDPLPERKTRDTQTKQTDSSENNKHRTRGTVDENKSKHQVIPEPRDQSKPTKPVPVVKRDTEKTDEKKHINEYDVEDGDVKQEKKPKREAKDPTEEKKPPQPKSA